MTTATPQIYGEFGQALGFAERTLSASTHHMRVDYSCYEGRKVRGRPEVVMQRGNVLVRDGQFLGRPGAGRFLPRSRFSPGPG